MKPVLFYLHGFNSSPASWKAQAVARYIAQRDLPIDYRVPRLPFVPDQVNEMLVQEMTALRDRRVVLMGSSMGGFYASCMAERFDLQAVLINPAVHPHELLRAYLGENRNYHDDEVNVLEECHIEQLRAMERPLQRPSRFWVLVQAGDETLDFRLATERYRTSRLSIEPGGSHGFDHFERHVPALLAWLRLPVTAAAGGNT